MEHSKCRSNKDFSWSSYIKFPIKLNLMYGRVPRIAISLLATTLKFAQLRGEFTNFIYGRVQYGYKQIWVWVLSRQAICKFWGAFCLLINLGPEANFLQVYQKHCFISNWYNYNTNIMIFVVIELLHTFKKSVASYFCMKDFFFK